MVETLHSRRVREPEPPAARASRLRRRRGRDLRARGRSSGRARAVARDRARTRRSGLGTARRGARSGPRPATAAAGSAAGPCARWRATLPLPVWSLGYGAGLGAGFFTFQPVSTFWVACAGAIALGRPVAAADLLRRLRRREDRHDDGASARAEDATSAVEALVRRRRARRCQRRRAGRLRGAARGSPLWVQPPQSARVRPAATGRPCARPDGRGGDERRHPAGGRGTVTYPSAASPAIDGDLLARVRGWPGHQGDRLDVQGIPWPRSTVR